MSRPWRGGGDQIRTIARATFDGFLQSDLMPAGMQAPAIIWAAAFFVGPALFFPAQALVKYPILRRFHPNAVEPALWSDRLLFLLMSAGAMGLVAVVLWQTLFPARRDVFVLTPLPVPESFQMLGRLMGLAALCGVFVLALNAIPSFMFAYAASPTVLAIPRWTIAHFIATSAFDLFVFFSITSLQGLVILVAGRRAAERLASIVQTGSVLVLMLALLFIGLIQQTVTRAILGHDTGPWALRWLPPAWFLGLFEIGTGTSRSLMTVLALRGLLAVAMPVLLTVAIYALGYRRLLVRAIETPQHARRSLAARAGSAIVRATCVRRPEEQAMVGFILRGLARSARHNMLLSIYIGAALAIMVTFVLPDVLRHGTASLAEPTVTGLALPLVLSAALATGVRLLMTIPADMPARWVFQTAGLAVRRVDAAVQKAMILVVVPVVMVTAIATAGPLWGARVGGLHAIYCASLAVMLCELLLLPYRGLPLTRPYVPGGAKIHMLWAVYLFGFLTYTLSFASLERTLLQWTGTHGVLIGAAIFFALAVILWTIRLVKLRQLAEVPFEAEEPEDVMFQGFNLSEIHAAQAVAAKDHHH